LNNVLSATFVFGTVSLFHPFATRSRGISVSIEKRLQAGRPGFDSQQGRDFFPSPQPYRVWGPPGHMSIRHWVSFLGDKAAGA